MSTCEFELSPCCNSFAQIALFRNVKNTKELKGMLLSGGLECCMIKPTLILDPFQIIVAVNKAVLNEKQQKMTTRNVFTEILYSLSASKNISQSLKKFGIDEEDKNLLVIVIRKSADSIMDRIIPLVVGDLCPIGEIKSLSDFTSIKKTYNVKEDELEVSPLLDSIVSRIAVKDIFSLKM